MGHHNELTLCSTIIILSINIPMSIMIQKSPQNFKVVIKLGGRHFSPYYPVQFTILLHRWFTIPVSKLGTVQLVLWVSMKGTDKVRTVLCGEMSVIWNSTPMDYNNIAHNNCLHKWSLCVAVSILSSPINNFVVVFPPVGVCVVGVHTTGSQALDSLVAYHNNFPVSATKRANHCSGFV